MELKKLFKKIIKPKFKFYKYVTRKEK